MTAVLATWLQNAVCGFFVRSTTGNDDFVRFARDQFCTIADLEVVLRSLEALVVDTWKSQLGV